MRLCTALVVCTELLYAQSQPPLLQESIVVTGVAEPIPLTEADRDVSVIRLPEKQRPLFDSWFDLLELDPALDLTQRAPGGFQADLSIRGATYGQTLIMLNGMRVDDIQSGHFNLDLPLPLEMITGIEVLKGSGSALYGSDAIGGAVNIRTEPIEGREFRVFAGLGNFGTNQEHAIGTFGGSWWQEELSIARDFSSGFLVDRDYRNLVAGSLSQIRTPIGPATLLLAWSDRPYGADQFYGPYPSWERTKSWFASGHQDIGRKTEASFAYRRHTDLFVLFRDDPAIYTNHHLAQSWQGDLRRRENLPLHAVLSYGVEGLGESVQSTNLGFHSRKRGSGYLFYDLRSVRRYSLSAGIREEVYGSHEIATSPSLSGAIWLSARIKLRAALSRAFRLPDYTDLYYSDPANKGNPNLKPEHATSYEAGVDAYLVRGLHAAVTVFQRRDSNVIDYVRASDAAFWQATNFDRLRFTGVESSLVFEPVPSEHFAVSFSALHGVDASPQILQSKYAFNYPIHSGVLEWRGAVGKRDFMKNVMARTRIGVVNRLARSPYAVWDASASYTAGRVRPFIQLTNITSTAYEEIPSVPMPLRGVIGGVELYLIGANR
jgi:iron complex outermembrane receptor protein